MAYDKITNAELEVLKTIWQSDSSSSVAQIRSQLADSFGWKATTVKTLLYNLRDKGAVVEVGRGVYRAVVNENDVTRHASKELITKLFNGSAKKLVAALIDDGEISENDVNELRALLNKRGDSND